MSDIIKESSTKSFESLFFQEKDKDTEKKKKFIAASQGKRHQLNDQIGKLHLEILDTETRFEASLIDPKIDSVAIRCQILALKEELQMTIDLSNELFPIQ